MRLGLRYGRIRYCLVLLGRLHQEPRVIYWAARHLIILDLIILDPGEPWLIRYPRPS